MTDKRDPIEAAARAAEQEFHNACPGMEGREPDDWECYISQSLAVIRAYLDAIADEWRLVPVKLNPDMVTAIEDVDEESGQLLEGDSWQSGAATFEEIWRAGQLAAPPPPGLEPPTEGET